MTVDERTLSAVLHRMADETEWRAGLPRRTVLRARTRRSLTVVLAVVLLMSVAYGSVVMAGAFRGVEPAGPHPLPYTTFQKLTITARTPVRSGITDVAASRDAVWVSGFQKLTRVDPASGRIVASIPLPGLGDYSSVALGAGAVWVTASERGFRGVYKIDPATNAIAGRIPLSGNVEGIAVGAGSVWVTHPQAGPGSVLRIDPRTDQVVGKPIAVGVGPVPILYAAGAVFVTNTDSGGSISRIDADTGGVTSVWGTANDVLASGGGSLWGVGNDEVVRIDVHTGRVVAAIPVKRAAGVAYGGGRLWVITDPQSKSATVSEPDPRHPGTVVTIDPATNRISSVPIPFGETAAYIAARGPVAWIGDYNKQVLTRVEATR
jgi:DNA-binding beta-propeller fold protein YncE